MLKLLADIFLSFFKIGLFTLGGGLAIISLVQQEMVGRGWLPILQQALRMDGGYGSSPRGRLSS